MRYFGTTGADLPQPSRPRRLDTSRRRRVLPVLACLALLVAGCSSGTGVSSGAAGGKDPGTVRVLYAGSLVNLMRDAGPAFEQATGAQFHGEAKGSTALANEIKGKVRQGDVYISASQKADDALIGKPNGDWVSWYANFASAPLVIAYNPKSKFAHDLKTKPWNQVITEPGFRMGATDPKLDPKGKLAAQALRQVGLGENAVQVFPEEQLLARLSSGNLDAGFFYSSEATDAGLPTVPLPHSDLAAHYTITVLNRAPNPDGARAFVKYLLGKGRSELGKHGLRVQPVTVAGDRKAVPTGLRPVLGVQ